jgi:hypothetical protein
MLLLSVLALGCGSLPQVGVFEPDAFYHSRGHYRVRHYVASYRRDPMPTADWSLENFLEGPNGPAQASPSPRFWTQYRLELDGRTQRPTRAELFDLRFVHRRDGTVLWSRSVPLPSTRGQTSLEVLARDYVELAASGSAIEVDFSGPTEARVRRFGPRMLYEGPAQVDGQPAYYVVFEHVDLDRREAAPDAVGDIVTLVFVRPHLPWRAGITSGHEWPMVLVFGYASRPERHAEHREAFEGLVSRVDLRRW